MSDENEAKFKIQHRRASNFAGTFANGVSLSLSPSGHYNLTFWEDVIGINSESATITGDKMTTEYLDDDTFAHREDKYRVTVEHSTLVAIRDMINRRLDALSESEDE